MPKVSFNNKNNSFFNSLKINVDNYFKENNLKKTGNIQLYSKTVVLISGTLLIYITLLTLALPVFVQIILCAVLGAFLASIGFNVMHDACHGSYSQKKWVNDTLGLSLNALGGNSFIWKFKHNILHHTYTNVDGMDDDIAKSPLMRQCRTQKWVPAHKFQHIYVVLVYAISSFAWVFIMDFNKYLKQRVNQTPMQKMSFGDHLVFWASKVLYIVFYIAIPVSFVGWAAWGIGFAVMHVIMGLTLALVFQLAHVVEHAEFESVTAEVTQLENAWAEHQVRSTANFAPKNLLINWYVGGLNYQVEHHLFPRISHIHYPALSKIVENTCKEYDLPYNSYPTMTQSMISHFKMMKSLGERP
jgi:linoleoyl-CoA desaturase